MQDIIYDIHSKSDLIIGYREENNARSVEFRGFTKDKTNSTVYLMIEDIGLIPLLDFCMPIEYSYTIKANKYRAILVEKNADDSFIKKSNIFSIVVKHSVLIGDIVAPEAAEFTNWFDNMSALYQTVQTKLRNGELKGEKGDAFKYSDFTTEQLEELKGEPGDNGTSPTANVVKTGNKSVITITDASGTTTAEVTDGAKGDPGETTYIENPYNDTDVKSRISAIENMEEGSVTKQLNDDLANLTTAESTDVGKALKVKSVSNNKVTEWEFGATADAYTKAESDALSDKKIDKPSISNNNKVPMAKNGDVEWVNVGIPTDEQTAIAVSSWLDEHPDATTTVQDNSIASVKFNTEAKKWIRGNRVYNVCDYGAVGDGVHNDAPAIRSAIADLPASNWVLYFPPGNYLQGDGSSECFFDFENKTDFIISGYGAKIIANPLNDPNEIVDNVKGKGGIKYRGFKFITCERGRIEGIYYDGNIVLRKPTMGDGAEANDQCAFLCKDCEYVFFVDCIAHGAMIDGFNFSSIGRTPNSYSNHCGLIRCQAYYCYRQGLSVVNGHYGLLDSCTFAYTGAATDEEGNVYGTSPKAGVDMEQGYKGYEDRGQKEWVIRNCTFKDNVGNGLALHWGSHDCVVDSCKLINNGIFIPQDSEYLTRNNTVKNCFFENCGIHSSGDGLIFEDNILVNGFPIVYEGNLLVEKGIARKNIIRRNLISYDFDISQESFEPNGYIDSSERRAFYSSTYDLDFIDNIIVNACGGLICYGKVDNLTGNIFKTNMEIPEGKYIGSLRGGAHIKGIENNIVEKEYINDDGTGVVGIGGTSKITKIVTKNQGKNYVKVHLFNAVKYSYNTFSIIVRGKNFEYILNHKTKNNYEIKRVKGDNYDISISNLISQTLDDGTAVMTFFIKSTDSTNKCFEVEIIGTNRFANNVVENYFSVEQLSSAPTIEGLVFKCPWIQGKYVTTLPSSTDFTFVNGDNALYNTKPIWYKGGKWYYADGAEAT